MRNFFVSAVLCTFLANPLNALSVNDMVSGAVGDITNSIAGSFGLPAFNVRCETGIPNIDLYSYCSIVDKLDLGLGNSFKIGSCSVGVADPLRCQREALRRLCQSTIRYAENKVGGYRKSVVNAITTNSEEMLGTGGKIIGDFTNCNFINNVFKNKRLPNGKTLEEIYRSTSLPMVKKHGIFNSITKDIRDCLKVTRNDLSCYNPADWTLPENLLSAEKDKSEVIGAANPNVSAFVKGTVENESQMSQQLQEVCKLSPLPGPCVDAILSQSGMTKKRDAVIANIETSAAVRKKLIESATTQKEEFVHRGDEVIKSMPREFRVSYQSGVSRANAADIVIENLYSTNVALQKEAIIILNNKVTDASEPFLETTSSMKIRGLLQ